MFVFNEQISDNKYCDFFCMEKLFMLFWPLLDLKNDK